MRANLATSGVAISALAALAFACGPGAFAGDTAPRDVAAVSARVVPEREISIQQLHLGLTPGGRVGVYLAYEPRRPRGLRTAGVAIGPSPRMVYGWYKGDRTLASPLRDVFPNDNELRSGRSYKVVVSFCRVDATRRGANAEVNARAAKVPCDRRSFISTRAPLHRRFAPPG